MKPCNRKTNGYYASRFLHMTTLSGALALMIPSNIWNIQHGSKTTLVWFCKLNSNWGRSYTFAPVFLCFRNSFQIRKIVSKIVPNNAAPLDKFISTSEFANQNFQIRFAMLWFTCFRILKLSAENPLGMLVWLVVLSFKFASALDISLCRPCNVYTSHVARYLASSIAIFYKPVPQIKISNSYFTRILRLSGVCMKVLANSRKRFLRKG